MTRDGDTDMYDVDFKLVVPTTNAVNVFKMKTNGWSGLIVHIDNI